MAIRTLLIASISVAAAQLHTQPVRYKDAVFANVAVTSDVRYGSAKTHAGAVENLDLDLYQPQGDTAKARPLFIWIHGGGFSGGTKTDADVVFLCRYFAQRGYVAASIEYRLQSPLNTQQAMGAEVLRAVQDAKAAVRFLRSRKADYRIDDTRIMMGGTSAGGALSLNYAYLHRDEVPAYVDTASLDGFEGKSGTPGVSAEIHGIVNCWGGLGDSTAAQDGKLPAIHFHGTADPTVPYDIGYSLGNPALVTYGSACVHRVLTRAGVRSVLKPFPGMGHGTPAGSAQADTLIAMTTDFAYDVLFASRPAGVRLSLGSGHGQGAGGDLRIHSLDGRRILRERSRARMPVYRLPWAGSVTEPQGPTR